MVLPVDVVVGIYLGLLSGIIPALIAFGLGFLFKYVTGITIPAFGVIVLALTVAGINGGLLALNDPAIAKSANAPTLITALIVILMLALFAHNRGDSLGATLPKRITLRGLRDRKLSADVVEFVGGRGQVRVEVVGEVSDVEGMPPLPDDIRSEIRGSEWVFSADLPMADLESQLEERLRAAHDLSEVSVRIDSEGRATVSAAPPSADVSKRVPRGERAVSVEALVPTGVARGDEVTVHTPERSITGTVVSAFSGGKSAPPSEPAASGDAVPDGGAAEAPERRPAEAPTTTGGEGRITLAVDRSKAEDLMDARLGETLAVVEPRGVRREYELLSLLRRAGHRFHRTVIERDATPGEGSTPPTVADVRDRYGVAVVALRKAGDLTIAPAGGTALEAGDEAYLVGTRTSIDAFLEGGQ